MNTPDIDQMIAETRANGGSTFYLHGEDNAGRYVVGGLATWVIHPYDVNAGLKLSDVISGAYREMHSHNAYTLGTWRDGDALYVDLGDTWTTYTAAMQVARLRDELAIWDRLSGEAISLD